MYDSSISIGLATIQMSQPPPPPPPPVSQPSYPAGPPPIPDPPAPQGNVDVCTWKVTHVACINMNLLIGLTCMIY